MKKFIYIAVEYAALIHDRIMTLNDGQASMLSDKQLHFLVIGLLGMLLFLLIHPLFKALIRRGHEIIVSWFYVFTVILVITFAIEIGQRISNTGTMEFFDIVYGVAGFFWMCLPSTPSCAPLCFCSAVYCAGRINLFPEYKV